MSETELKTDEARISYGIGLQFGAMLRNNPPLACEMDAIYAGILDGYAGQARLREGEIDDSFQRVRIAKDAVLREQGKAADEAAKSYLKINSKMPGVVECASGLQYEVLIQGEGEKPTRSSIVRVHYQGTLLDGTVFDSSYERNEPAEFAVTGVIAAWTEALPMMNVGSKWRLFIPSDLAYGNREIGIIPPHSALIFEIELLEILPNDQPLK